MSHPPPRSAPPASAGLARRLYEDGAPLAEIRRQTGLSRAQVYYWIDRDVAADGSVTLKPAPRRRPPTPPASTAKRTTSAKPATSARRTEKIPRRAARPSGTAPKASVSPRRRLLARLWRAAERQVADIEARLGQAVDAEDASPSGPRRSADTEKDARALALLARTLRELSAAEERADPARSSKAGTANDDSTRDLDSFRRELARRLERLRAEGEGGEAAG